MNNAEHIALELTRILATTNPDLCQKPKWLIKYYTDYLKELQTPIEMVDTIKQVKLLKDENDTYKYILHHIKELIAEDDNNFVLKEKLEEMLGGIE